MFKINLEKPKGLEMNALLWQRKTFLNQLFEEKLKGRIYRRVKSANEALIGAFIKLHHLYRQWQSYNIP